MITVQGYSDDLIEISRIHDGKETWEEEWDSYGKDTLFKFDDGTKLRMHYDGTWRAIIEERGTAEIEIVPLIARDGDHYSDRVTIQTDIVQAHWKEDA